MLADSPGSAHSSSLHMNPCNSTLIFISHAPGVQTYVQYIQMDRRCQLSPPSPQPLHSFVIHHLTNKSMLGPCASTHACLHAISPSLSLSPLSPSHLAIIFMVLVDRGHLCISGQLHQIQKDIRATPPPYPV